VAWPINGLRRADAGDASNRHFPERPAGANVGAPAISAASPVIE